MVVLVWSTILYQASDLGQTFGSAAFTKHYHRDEGLTIGLGVEVTVGRWATVIRVDNVENRRHTQKGSHGGGRCQKEKNF